MKRIEYVRVMLATCVALAIPACQAQGEEAPDDAVAAEPSADDAPTADTATQDDASTADAGFDPAGVAESTADLPPFPFFEPLPGLTNRLSGQKANSSFDVATFWDGDRLVEVEGKRFSATYPLGNDGYSNLEFRRNYENAIRDLGGVQVVSTDGDAIARKVDLKTRQANRCIAVGCDIDTYLIRKDGQEYWISVMVGDIPRKGLVTVVQREAMTQSLAMKSADALKSALDADGRVPVFIEFDLDKATLQPAADDDIAEIVKLLADNPTLELAIEGHTDASGTAAHNKDLSERRARTVKERLVAAGIDGSRLTTAGYGATRPLAKNREPDAAARNRRVELVRR